MPEGITPIYNEAVAQSFDLGRPITDENLNFVLGVIRGVVGQRTGVVRFLDFGCGVGRFSIPVARELGYEVTAADKSARMIKKAQRKDGADLVRKWEVHTGARLQYEDNSFDIFFISHVLHHIKKPADFIREVSRVLKPRGVFINRYGAIEDIKKDPVHRFFPEALEIDLKRTPSKDQVESWLIEMGFTNIRTQTVEQPSFSTPVDQLEKVKLKMISVLHLISQEAFERGVKGYEDYLKDHGDEGWLTKDLMSYTTAVSLKAA